MGAPASLPAPTTSARAISTALSEKAAGNPLSYFRLQHTLSSRDAPSITSLLSGLMHFASASASVDLRQLIDLALRVDLSALCEPSPTREYPALDALLCFAENLVSADAAYVHPVLENFVAGACALPVDKRGPIVKYATRAVVAVLRAYPRAATMLIDVLRKRFPHPVRPADEHVAYLRAVLAIARDERWPAVGRCVIATVMERLATIEALVPDDVFGAKGELLPEAAKMQAVLLELFAHVDAGADGSGYAERVFEPLFVAYESAIVSVEATRFSPYVLLYAASKGGTKIISAVVERLRLAFFDEDVSQQLREKFLQHSSAMVIRAKMVSPAAAKAWIASLARWLNRYVDAQERFSDDVQVDTDVHLLFYSACCALMTTLAKRGDALDADEMNAMRLYRIMACEMNPLLVVPAAIVQYFASVVSEIGAGSMDFEDIIERNKGRYTPSRTKYGSRNECEYTVRCPELELAAAREGVEDYVRRDSVRLAEGKDAMMGSPASARAAMDTFDDMVDV